jgi:hypothetical protein
MKTILALITVIALTGCIATPVKRTFPPIPTSLNTPCEELVDVPAGTNKLSEVLLVVTKNYSLYHECKLKVETWNDWYKQQKEIFDSVK